MEAPLSKHPAGGDVGREITLNAFYKAELSWSKNSGHIYWLPNNKSLSRTEFVRAILQDRYPNVLAKI